MSIIPIHGPRVSFIYIYVCILFRLLSGRAKIPGPSIYNESVVWPDYELIRIYNVAAAVIYMSPMPVSPVSLTLYKGYIAFMGGDGG